MNDILQYKGLALEGGGVLGTAYAGVTRALEEHGILNDMNLFAGTSAGSIAAGVLGCKAGHEFMTRTLRNLDYNIFLDDSWGIIRDIRLLFKSYGWHKGDAFCRWYRGVLQELTGNGDITFEEAFNRYGTTIKMVGVNVTQGKVRIFDRLSNPNMIIYKAARISMSVPGLIASVKLNGDHYVDGGLMMNYPISVFDDTYYLSPDGLKWYQENMPYELQKVPFNNNEILGIKLDNRQEILYSNGQRRLSIDGPKEFAKRTAIAVYNLAQQAHIRDYHWKRTCVIDCNDIDSLDFDISNDKRDYLIQRGYEYTLRFINR